MSAPAPAVDPYALPDDATVDRAVANFARRVRKAYGERVKGIYLFGSRARGDHRPESDADVAVVLADGDWGRWAEIMRLSDLEYDIIVDTGADIQGWPLAESEWVDPDRHTNPGLARSIRRDARAVSPEL